MQNPIGWCHKTLNIITGCLGPQGKGPCPYCYASDFAPRLAGIEKKHPGRTGYPTEGNPFQPTFHPDKLEDLRKLGGKPKRVFLDSMSDWFGESVKPEWVHAILDMVDIKPEHTFLVLTKSPENILRTLHCRELPSNFWLGVSVTSWNDLWRIKTLHEQTASSQHRFVSFEPLHSHLNIDDWSKVEWAIIGQESGNRKGKIWIQKSWIDNICWQANQTGIPVYLKSGMCGPKADGSYDLREEYPEAMCQ